MAPGGTLRFGVVEAPAAGVFFVGRGPDGQAAGVTAAFGAALARHAGVPITVTVFQNSGECTDAVASAAIDAAFMPVDASRAARVAFGPGYYRMESTFLVSGVSGFGTLAEVDRDGVRVVGIADTTTIRAATRSLLHTVPVACRSVDEAVAMLRRGEADAIALSRDSLNQIMPSVPGSRIVAGGYQQTTISIAVPPGRPEALAVATAFLAAAKRDGLVRRLFDAAGLADEVVAP